MPPAPARTFAIADALILVAATAVGLDATRRLGWELTWKDLRHAWSVNTVADTITMHGIYHVVPCLACWSVAILLLMARGPRPARGRPFRSPGLMACLVVAGVIVLTVAGGLLMWGRSAPGAFFATGQNVSLVLFGTIQAGAAVLWAWVAMALCGRWRPERSWPGRLGRLLGAAWIALAFPAIRSAIYLTF